MTLVQYFVLLLVTSCLISQGEAQSPAPANDGLLLPVALGFLLKVVLVVLGGMVKLLFLGFTSLGTSGVALLLGILFLKNQGLAIPPWSPHHRIDHSVPVWLRPHAFAYSRQRNAKQLDTTTSLYKPNDGKRNGEHPVPVAAPLLDPRGIPHFVVGQTYGRMLTATAAETENATSPKRTSKDTQTYALAN